ncbi:hypothetical protein ACQVP2_23100 [Methylobacterium aquaticum]|uniref:hypothetical protein n=1 Tax=Methylobacterium aquaticum TaxID=270351 RepID=UPI003D16D5ED
MMLSAIWGGVLAAELGYVVSGWPGALAGFALSRLALAGQRFGHLGSCLIADFCRRTGDHFGEICLGALLTLLFGPGRETLPGVGRWLDRWWI